MQNAIAAFSNLAPLTQFLLWIMLFLVVPGLCERFKVPGVLGFILLGWLLGPNGIGLLDPDSLVSRMGSELGVGLLLFFVGFEIDFALLKKARAQVLCFGIATFGLPLAAGTLVARLAGFELNAALLIGSLLASHTLLAYPIVERAGLVGRLSVVATAGATVFTDVAAMVVLAVCLLVHQTGFSESIILKQLVQIAVFVPLMIFGASWLIKQLVQRVRLRFEAQLLLFFVLVAGGSEAATLFGLDGIVGAFMAGIAARRAIRREEPTHVLKVVANTFLIPAFFMATGMLIQPAVLVETLREQPLLALGLVAALVAGKFLAAWTTGKLFGYQRAEIGLCFSLTLPQVAATLAATTVAYRTVNAAQQPLISHEVLNAVLLLVVLTSIGGPLLSQRYVSRLAAQPVADPAALPEGSR
ncbi:cation:proton antiporter [Paucibacter sp. XJ19-41]|uniref:cation:proton antiporter n=1 Tax=Paucibacter sp. XJ19-41 TaxID=2927824 RepID=UPI00234A7DFA|nr:cation:proton antiporter [Paucibacter sp. XJ19-41]MDC6169661.1 cation:proton antiporter [Paucibacter sp. XJ19-41]